MRENTHLNIENLSAREEKECRIVSARQIASILRGLSKSGEAVALYFDGARDSIATSVLEVGENGLWVEQCTDASRNRRIAESKDMTLVSAHDRIKIQFSANGAEPVSREGYAAFYLPLPDAVYRIQRRESFRLVAPASERLRCVIPTAGSRAGKVEVLIADISGNGVKLSYSENDIVLVIGQTYTGCRIDFPGVGKIEVTLIVKSLAPVKPGQALMRAGCEFKDIDHASGILLQRYVTKIQCLKTGA